MKRFAFTVVMAAWLGAGNVFGGINDGLVAYYPFEGNAADASGNGWHGSNHTGVVQYYLAQRGRGAWFDGGTCLQLPQRRLLDGASNATITAWILFTDAAGGQLLSAGDYRGGLDPISVNFTPTAADNLHFEETTAGPYVMIGMERGEPIPGLGIGHWRPFTMLLERQTTQSVFRCYVGTNLVNQSTNTQFTRITYDQDMQALIGAVDAGWPWQFWHGAIDELRVYDRALSQAEIEELYKPEPRLTIEVAQVRICWDAPSNQLSQVQYRSELTTNAWVDLVPPIPGAGTNICLTDEVVGPRRFYRVLFLP